MTKVYKKFNTIRAFITASQFFVILAAVFVPSIANANTIYACISNRSGEIRIVSANTNCHQRETRISWNTVGPQGPPGPAGSPYPVDPVFSDTWSGVTAGAAAGYCLAKHPYQNNTPGLYTTDGYEKVGSPGIVGAVRRNYVYGRTTTAIDEGVNQTCAQACREMGRGYEPTYQGQALHQQVSGGGIITSGIGDMASMALPDQDFYTGRKTVAGMVSRANTYQESDVAQADYCCCDVTTPP